MIEMVIYYDYDSCHLKTDFSAILINKHETIDPSEW